MSSEHIVTSYEDELTDLARAISEMGGMVEAAISTAINALLKLDHETAKQIIAADKAVDDMQRKIDETAVSMIARRQPMAADLRMIISSVHVANDLERIGDMAKNIARRTLQIDGNKLSPQFYNGVRHMTDLILQQIKDALDSFANRDTAAAIAVCERDDEVDALYMSLFRELLTYMMEDPRNITQCTNLLFCGKNLERTGDHATNIAEAAYYLETGKNLPVILEEKAQQKS
ncbi:phosphate signaling complex protein PhoU [Mariluticola halotolerans]|uniref:phosphate signaling complex protein PhoU n=1 Tax=Mariluticola halotolerans TaxID=2909283 RepID=UPI0026E27F46|nr:phosphate signaling complex protein PhoU [Mariluticola halotolerans]UJQ93052.1 phosphate signaling complex protein PhoU [Mariluticola halotolerans]